MTDIAQSDQPPPVTFVDNPHAPDIFADGATGFFRVLGNIKITLECGRVNHSSSPGPVSRVVIGRLVMPIEQAEGLARGLLDFINQQRTQQNPPAQAATGTLH
jgi:hypothetical protein